MVTRRVIPSQKLHMTGKPIELMESLVAPVPPGGHILDPFMGSASTGVAALRKVFGKAVTRSEICENPPTAT